MAPRLVSLLELRRLMSRCLYLTYLPISAWGTDSVSILKRDWLNDLPRSTGDPIVADDA
jgi:hypothetical protein